MQAGDHIQSSETAPQDSTPSTSYSSSTSESSARWDAKKRAVKVTPPPPPPLRFLSVWDVLQELVYEEKN